MEKVAEVVVSEGVETCAVMSKTGLIGRALLITAALGGVVLIAVKVIKKGKAKKAAKLAAVKAADDTQQ